MAAATVASISDFIGFRRKVNPPFTWRVGAVVIPDQKHSGHARPQRRNTAEQPRVAEEHNTWISD
jgi:hypothetical protein